MGLKMVPVLIGKWISTGKCLLLLLFAIVRETWPSWKEAASSVKSVQICASWIFFFFLALSTVIWVTGSFPWYSESSVRQGWCGTSFISMFHTVWEVPQWSVKTWALEAEVFVSITPSSAIHQLCDLRQVAEPLWALVLSSIERCVGTFFMS